MRSITMGLVFAVLAAGADASAKPVNCEALKARIDAKLRARGAGRFMLELLDAGASAEGRVIGRCAAGAKKIVYVKGGKAAVATPTVPAVAAAAVDAGLDEKQFGKLDIAQLIATLHKSRNESLYYSFQKFPPNVIELERREGTIGALAAAYYGDKEDPMFRFNIIMLLNYKLEHQGLSKAELEMLGRCLADGLRDSFSWVRIEAVWGLKFTDDEKYEAAVQPLLKDSDELVRYQARNTADSLHRLALSRARDAGQGR